MKSNTLNHRLVLENTVPKVFSYNIVHLFTLSHSEVRLPISNDT